MKHSLRSGFTPMDHCAAKRGFTLIELSIVLVIIGLITGGVLVGRDLITAATVRAQVSQIEKYQSAVNTFRGKYGYLPGDIPDPVASQFSFIDRGAYAGQGDGNGVLEGSSYDGILNSRGVFQGVGETTVFWRDLSTANLLNGGFNTARSTVAESPGITVSGADLDKYFPKPKLGGAGMYVYVWSGGWADNTNSDQTNYFGISSINSLIGGDDVLPNIPSGIRVIDAYNIDTKIDDGLPQSGRVMTWFTYANVVYWAGTFIQSPPYTTATLPDASTCFDNAGGTGPQKYSVGVSGGTGLNCALSFRFQ